MSARFLRGELTKKKKAARAACSPKRAKKRAKRAGQRIALAEYNRAMKVCEAYRAQEGIARAEYERARPVVTPAKRRARERAAERKHFTERDAVGAVVAQTGFPENIARIAVRTAMREARGRGARRWELIVERASRGIDEAWRKHLLEEERAADKAFRMRGGASSPKKKRRRNWYDEQEERDERQRRERGARIQPVMEDELVVVLEDAPF